MPVSISAVPNVITNRNPHDATQINANFTTAYNNDNAIATWINGAFGNNIVTNGHYILPGGLQFAWGELVYNSSSSATLTFDRAFSATPLGFTLGANAGVFTYESSMSASAITITLSSSSTMTVWVFAWGAA